MHLVYRVRAYDQLPQRSFNDLVLGIIEMRFGHSDPDQNFVNKRRIIRYSNWPEDRISKSSTLDIRHSKSHFPIYLLRIYHRKIACHRSKCSLLAATYTYDHIMFSSIIDKGNNTIRLFHSVHSYSLMTIAV